MKRVFFKRPNINRYTIFEEFDDEKYTDDEVFSNDEIYADDDEVKSMKTFKPSDIWSKETNMNNFMGGIDDDYEHDDDLKNYLEQQIIWCSEEIIDGCNDIIYDLTNIFKKRHHTNSIYNKHDFAEVDFDKDENIIHAKIPFGADSVLKFNVYPGTKTGSYTIDTPSAAREGADHYCLYGDLQYNLNKKEKHKLFLGIVKSILNDSLYKEDYGYDDIDASDILKILPNTEKVNAAMKNAYKSVVDCYKTCMTKIKNTKTLDINFLTVVRYTLNGDAVLSDIERKSSLSFDHINNKKYHGLNRFPLFVKGGEKEFFDVIDDWGIDDETNDIEALNGRSNTTQYIFTKGYELCNEDKSIHAFVTFKILVEKQNVFILEIVSDNDDIDTNRSKIVLAGYIQMKAIENIKKTFKALNIKENNNTKKYNYLREFDEPEPHYTADAREVEAYWKRACHADFPKETKHLRFPLYNTWQTTYSELNYEKKQAELAKEKELEKIKKQRERELNKKLKKKSGIRSGWVNVVRYVFNGDAAIHDEHKNSPMCFDHINSKEYKGLNEFILRTKDNGIIICRVIDRWGCDDEQNDIDIINGKFNSIYYPFTVGYEVCNRFNKNETFNISIRVGVFHNDVNIEEIHTDNDNIDIDKSIISLDKDIKKKCVEIYKNLILDNIIKA